MAIIATLKQIFSAKKDSLLHYSFPSPKLAISMPVGRRIMIIRYTHILRFHVLEFDGYCKDVKVN